MAKRRPSIFFLKFCRQMRRFSHAQGMLTYTICITGLQIIRIGCKKLSFKDGGISVWYGVITGKIIVTHMFHETLNGNVYFIFLMNELPPLLEFSTFVSLKTRLNMFFYHDGCWAHCSRNVREYLISLYPEKWIGRESISLAS